MIKDTFILQFIFIIYRNKAVLEWNKKHLDYSMLKANNKNNSLSLVKDLKRLDSSAKHGIISTFKPKNQLQEIPTIENSIPFNNVKWSNIVESKKNILVDYL